MAGDSCHPETYALKVINKAVLKPQEIIALKGESTIMCDMVGRANIVQFLNIFETDKFIIIQMEHLKGSNMKRDLTSRIAQRQEQLTERTQSSGLRSKNRAVSR